MPELIRLAFAEKKILRGINQSMKGVPHHEVGERSAPAAQAREGPKVG